MSGPDTPWPLPKVGDPAPDIDLPTADGKTWRLADHAGHHVVVIFHRHIH